MAEAERILSTAELNRALLARQMLLERKRLLAAQGAGADRRNPGPVRALDVHRAVDTARGLRAGGADPGAGAPHRGPGNPAAGDDPPGDAGRLVALLGCGAAAAPRALAVRPQGRAEREADGRRDEAAAKAPRRGAGRVATRSQELIGQGSRGTNGASIWTDLVRVPPSGTWERRRADLFAEAERWIGPDPEQPQRPRRWSRRCRSYLRGFGPADQGGDRRLDRGSARPRSETALRADRAAPLPRPRRPGAGRPAAGAAARSRDTGPGQVPADLGRDPARPRPPHPDPPRPSTGARSSARRPRSRSRPSPSTGRSPGPGATRRGG